MEFPTTKNPNMKERKDKNLTRQHKKIKSITEKQGMPETRDTCYSTKSLSKLLQDNIHLNQTHSTFPSLNNVTKNLVNKEIYARIT